MNSILSKLFSFIFLLPALVFFSGCKKTEVEQAPGDLATVLSVVSLTSPGTYTVGKEVLIQVTFSKTIAVTGDPKLYLATGANQATASYVSGSGTNKLLFSYIVGPNQKTANLDYQGTSALNVVGGYIRGPNGRNARLDLPEVGTENSLSANSEIEIDSQPPTSTTIQINSGLTHTNNVNVQLNLGAVEASEMLIANSQTACSGADSESPLWEDFSTVKPWVLSAANQAGATPTGMRHTIFVKYRDLLLNASNCISASIIFNNIPPTADWIVIEPNLPLFSGIRHTKTTSVSLSLAATGAHQMYVTNVPGCAIGGSWETYTGSRTWTLAQSNTTTAVYVKFRDQALNESDCILDSIIHDNQPPDPISIAINNNNQFTNNTAVTLSLSAPGAHQMYVTNNAGCFSGGNWEAMSSTRAWTLGQINSIALVYVKFRDPAMNETPCISDSISHRTEPPSCSVSINSGSAYTTTTAVTLGLTTSDPSQVYVTNSAGCNSGGSWQAFSASRNWTLNQTNATATVYVKCRDNAENESSCVSDTIIHDDIPPQSPALLINQGDSHTNTDSISLAFSANEASEVYLTSTPGCSSGGTWETYVNARAWTLAPNQLNTNATLYAKFKDLAGNETACVSDSIIHDSIAPTGSLEINSNASYTNSTTVNLTLAMSEAGEMSIWNSDQCAGTPAWESFSSSKSWSIGTQTNQIAVVSVRFRDQAGNQSSCVSKAIIHDDIPPQSISILLDNGLLYTNKQKVTAFLGSNGASEIYLTNTPGCDSGGAWEPVTNERADWTLGQFNASATVYVKFRDLALNETACISDSIIHDNIAPTNISLNINSSAAYTRELPVVLSPQATGASQMYISNSEGCATGGTWETYNTTKSWTLPQSNATNLVYIKYKDLAQNETACISHSIIHDNIPPQNPTISINSGAERTNAIGVTLTLSAIGASQMWLTNTPGCSEAPTWQDYATLQSWNLAQTNAEAVVYVKYIDLAGNETDCLGDTIIHDSTPPVISRVSSSTPDGYYKAGSVISLQVVFNEPVVVSGTPLLAVATGGAPVNAIYTSGSGTDTLTFLYTVVQGNTNNDLDYVSTNSITISDASIRDLATNAAILNLPSPGALNSLSYAKSIVIDTTPPTSTNISILNNTSYTNSTHTTLNLSATGASEMFVSNNSGCNSGGDWEPYSASRAWTLLQQNATATVYVKFKDLAQNESSCISDTIIHDDIPPDSNSILINGGSERTNAASPYQVTLTLSSTDLNSVTHMMISNNSNCGTGTWESYNTSKNWLLGQNNALATVFVKFRDIANNETGCFSDTIIHDNIVPTVNSVSSTTPNGIYTVGANLSFQVTFSEIVTVSGTPQLTLETGAVDFPANYVSGSGTPTLTFEYTVKAGDMNLDLDYTGTSALTLNSGTIQDLASNSANRNLPNPGSPNSLSFNKDINVDTEAPTFTSIQIDSGKSYTNSPITALYLSATGASEMYVTNTLGCDSGGLWEPYVGVKSNWEINQRNSSATVYVKFRDLVGNVSSCISDSITHDDIAPNNPSVTINASAAYTKNTTVTLGLGASDLNGVAEMYITNTANCTEGGVWDTFANSKTWSISQTNQTALVFVRFKDSASNISPCISASIIHDNIPPSSASISINSGSSYSMQTSVTLSLGVTGATQMYVTNTPGCSSNGTWESYFSLKPWTLAQENATNTVYVKFRDDALNEGACISDTIIHDNIAPTLTSILIDSGVNQTNSSSVTLSLGATGASEVFVTNNSNCTSGGSWQPYVTSRTWTISQLNASATVYAKFRDEVGNESNCTSDSILHDSIAPDAPSININSSASHTRVTGVTLTLSATDSNGVTEMYITNTPACASGGTWQTNANSRSWVLSQTNEVASVFVKFRDASGNESACVSDTIIHDSTPPSDLMISINNGDAYTGASNPYTVSLSLFASDTNNISEMYITNTAGCGSGSTWEPYATVKNWNLGQNNTTTSVFVKYRDPSGNESQCISDSIIHDANSPTVTQVTSPTPNGFYTVGSTITIQVDFSENVVVTGNPILYLETGTVDGPANYLMGSGTSTLFFSYVVSAGEMSSDLDFAGTSALTLNGGSIRDLALNNASLTLPNPGGIGSIATGKNIVIDTEAPSSTNLSIFNGNTHTNLSLVDLNMAYTGATQMYITNTVNCTSGGIWENVSGSKLGWALSQTNTTATVYAKFRDQALNESPCISDTIIHDNIPPSGTSILINNNASYTTSGSVSLSLQASGASQMYITNTVDCTGGGEWTAYSTSSSWTLGQTNRNATVYIKYRDLALNESTCISDTIIHDDVPPTSTSITINSGAQLTNLSTVNLTLDAIGASEMYITNIAACASGGAWEPYLPSKTWLLTQLNSSTNVYVKYRDIAGNESPCRDDGITHDDSAPTSTSITINSNAAFTNQTNVTLTLGATGATEMYLTDTPDCVAGGAWEPYLTDRTWNLAQANATSTVYAKFRDAARNESSCISDSIVHDNNPPTGTGVLINSGASVTNSTSVTLTLSATGASQVFVTNTPNCVEDTNGTWETYIQSRSWTLSQQNGIATVYVRFRDAALNTSECIASSITHDSLAPTQTSILINNGNSHTNSSAVTLTLAATGASEMYLTNTSGCATGGAWEVYQTSKAWMLAQSNVSVSVFVKYRDLAGNESECISGLITHDTIAPSGTSISVNGTNTITNSTSVSLNLAATGASEMYVTNTPTCSSGGTWEGYATSRDWVLAQVNTEATVYVKFRDQAQNVSACVSDTIIHDSTPPTGTLTINSGDTYATSTSVTLSISAPEATRMFIANSATECASGTLWENISATKAWTLTQTNSEAIVFAKFQDAALNVSPCVSDTIIHDGIAPTISSVSSTTPNGNYSIGANISIQVNFSEPVFVFGTPLLSLETGSVDAVAQYTSGSGTSTLIFSYVVNPGEASSDLNYVSTSALSLNSGTIKDVATNSAILTLPALGATESLAGTKALVIDTEAPTSPALSIANSDAYTRTALVNLTPSALGASEMYLTNVASCASGGAWESYSGSKSAWAIAQTNSLATVYVKFRDLALNESACVSDTIIHDNIPPANPAVSINNGALFTTSDSVVLTLSALDADTMYVTNALDCGGTVSWSNYSSSQNWTLAQTNQVATVFVRYKDLAGNEGACVSDTITHDNTAPTGSITINNFAEYTTSTAVTLTLSATGASEIYVTNALTCTEGGAWEPYTATKAWTLGQNNTTATVRVRFRDDAGNVSGCFTDSITHDDLGPTATSIIINDGIPSPATHTSTVNVTLTLAATDAIQMYITNTINCTSGGSWQNAGTSQPWVLGQTNNEAKVYAKFRDLAGNESACVSDSIIHDSIAPSADSIIINNGAAFLNTAAPGPYTVSLSLGATGATHMYITQTEGCASGGTWSNYSTTPTWNLSNTNTLNTIYVKFRDLALNESTCISSSITHDNIIPAGSILINNGANQTNSTNVSLTLAASGATQMYVTNTPTCSGGGAWETYTGTKAWTLAQTNLLATVYVKFKDAAGNESICESSTITHDNTAPTATSIIINDANPNPQTHTATTSVSLTLTSTDATQMYVTNTAGCTSGGTWETASTSKPWVLGQTNSEATVYVKFRDAALNESACVSDSIIHDNIAPTADTLTINSGALYTNTAAPGPYTVSLSIGATGASQMYLTQNSTCSSGGAWTSYSTTALWDLTTANALNTIYVKFRDLALNESQCISSSITHDNTAPIGSININNFATYTTSSIVTLTLAAPTATEMYVTNTLNCTGGGAWEPYSSSKVWTLGATNSDTTVYVRFKDAAGNLSNCESDLITHDNTGPNAVSVIINNKNPNPDTHTNTINVELTLAASNATQMYVTNTPTCSGGGIWENFASATRTWVLAQTNSEATVYVKFRDAALNESACVSDSIIHDNIAPTADQILINNGALYTNIAAPGPYNVNLTLGATGASQMYLTQNSDCASGGNWEAFNTTPSWPLSTPNATNTIYAKFRDLALNESTCISASITHDNTSPTGSLIINNLALRTNSTTVTLTLASSGGATKMYVTNTASCASGGAWEAVSANKTWTLSQTNQTALVYVKFKDAAGNESICVSDEIIHDDIAPTATSIVINNGTPPATYTTSTSVTLALGATGASEMYVTNTPACVSGGSWESAGTSKPWTLSQTNTTSTVYVKFRDLALNESTCISDTIIHDDTAPDSLSILINNGDNSTNTTSAQLTLQANNATEMYVTNTANCASGATWEAFSTTKAWTLPGLGMEAAVYAKFRDAAGNESQCVSDWITVLPAAPANPTSVTATATSSTALTVSWVTGGGSTTSFQVAYQTGSSPSTCNTGTVIGSPLIGGSTSVAVTGLSSNTTYYFRVCALDSNGTMSSGDGATGSGTTYPTCGSAGNGCYGSNTATTRGFATLTGGPNIEYVLASGSFYVWKEKGGNRILKATGLWSTDADWQKKLTRAGTGFKEEYLTDLASLSGRVCPTHVFLSHSTMTATGQCLYYDGGNAEQRLDVASGTEGEDWLLGWNRAATGRGTLSSYYEGNIKTCADKGMRLPTLYEISATSNVYGGTNYQPTGDLVANGGSLSAHPSFAGANGVPSHTSTTSWTWTASAATITTTDYWLWSGTSSGDSDDYNYSHSVRCVLPAN